MELVIHSSEEYSVLFNNPYHVFNTAAFNQLNRAKCEELQFLSFKDKSHRIGLIAGVKNGLLVSPFSAPFGGFSFLSQDVRISHIEEAVSLLERYIAANNLKGIKMVLPPLFYNETVLAKLMNVLYRAGYENSNLDLDYYIKLADFDNYLSSIWYNARKNLKLSISKPIDFVKCGDKGGMEQVYGVIAANRAFRGFPMTMSFDDIISTSKVITTDFFLVSSESQSIASAIAYHVNETTVYIPYWGDRNGYNEMKPMNFLAYKLFEHYKKAGKEIVHIGIGTENSIPNYGLCEFKESIGCTVTPKYTYFKKIQ